MTQDYLPQNQNLPNQYNYYSYYNQNASGNAIASLVLGILSWVLCFCGIGFILGIVAWILGQIEVGRINKGFSSYTGKTMALVGMWLGIANVILSVILMAIYIYLILTNKIERKDIYNI